MKEIIVATVVTLFLLGMGEAAHASSKAECEVMTIHASNSGQGIDTALTRFETIFKKSPLSGFNSFKLVDRQIIEMKISQKRELTLPDAIGGSLHLDRQNKGLSALTLTLYREGKKPITIRGRASPGAPLFAAGMRSAQGIWVFGIACKEKNSIRNY